MTNLIETGAGMSWEAAGDFWPGGAPGQEPGPPGRDSGLPGRSRGIPGPSGGFDNGGPWPEAVPSAALAVALEAAGAEGWGDAT